MLRSPDGRQASYLRLAPEEVELIHLMDGSRTLARLVADFARISGRLAPEQVRRVVADLAGNRMLEELPVDAFRPLDRLRRKPWPVRFGRGLLAFIQGRRVIVANIDPLVGFLYRAGARVLFTRPVAALLAAVAVVGLVAFGWQWWTGAQSVFLTEDSYVTGAAVLLGLNIVALACHELGHALATKHAGRRVPTAGFLVYFGIPSVFVDTTDVWMAGRRGRLLTTAAGPATGLILAGASAIVGFTNPALAPWCFKLSFAWYINALFNLNPFLALDGYYLLMDWLEVPNLRARGLSWVAARVRRRPPSWRTLDREGRLIALYGLLSIGWIVIALNIAYRVYVDRVDGLITGLWRSGWPARVLLVALVAGLASPLVFILCGWLGRRWRRFRERRGERRLERDVPKRLDALRASGLRDLPPEALAGLAARSRWVRPRTGEQLVFAGAAQPEVFTVVEGALEARAPGDPGGMVRERVGVGGVVGLGPAIRGAPSPLAWYAAGTKLLAMPSSAVSAAVPAGGLAAAHREGNGAAVEAEMLFAESPGLAALSYEDRLGLASVAVPVALPPGATVMLSGPSDAIVVASGVIATPDGYELGRGTLIGPAGEDLPGGVAVARTAVRMFSLPAVGGFSLLLGKSATTLAAESDGQAPGGPPISGVHPPHQYPPLAAPPGPPPPGIDDETDGRFERKLRWLLLLVLVLALLMTGGNVALAPLAWAEMPTTKAHVHVDSGTADVVVDGVEHELSSGDDIYVGAGDGVTVGPRSRATMTFRGGSVSVLCAGSDVAMGEMHSSGRPVQPVASFAVLDGIVLTDSASGSPAFEPLAARITGAAGLAENRGAAWFGVAPWGIVVADGTVSWNGSVVESGGGGLSCGNEVVPRPIGTPTPEPTPSESPSPSAFPSPSASPSASPDVVAPTTSTTTNPPPTSATTTTAPPTTSPPPPPNSPPVINGVFSDPNVQFIYAINVDGQPCNGEGPTTVRVLVDVSDKDHDLKQLRVLIDLYVAGILVQRQIGTVFDGTHFVATVGDVSESLPVQIYFNPMAVRVRAADPAGGTADTGDRPVGLKVQLIICRLG